MAQKKPVGRGAKERQVVSGALLREYAEQLRQMAARYERYAEDCELLAAGEFPASVGNWRNALAQLDRWLNTQVVPRLIKAAQNRGVAFEVSFRPPDED